MEVFIVAYTDNKPVPTAPPQGVRDHIAIANITCLALGEGVAPTSTDIARAYGIHEGGQRTGVVVKVGGYHGYAANNIWEKLRSWEALSL